METKTASEIWDIMEELGIAVDKSFFEPCDLTPPTLEELRHAARAGTAGPGYDGYCHCPRD